MPVPVPVLVRESLCRRVGTVTCHSTTTCRMEFHRTHSGPKANKLLSDAAEVKGGASERVRERKVKSGAEREQETGDTYSEMCSHVKFLC